MVMIGVMKSRLPASVGILAINHVSHIARVGSADGDDGMNSFKKGIVSSAAIAARSRGALNIKRNKCLGYMCIYTELYLPFIYLPRQTLQGCANTTHYDSNFYNELMRKSNCCNYKLISFQGLIRNKTTK